MGVGHPPGPKLVPTPALVASARSATSTACPQRSPPLPQTRERSAHSSPAREPPRATSIPLSSSCRQIVAALSDVNRWVYRALTNRRRTNGSRSAELQRLRSERVERSFAHTCRTGRARRPWLRGLIDVSKRYLIHVAAHNIGRIMRSLFGIGTPRGLQGPSKALQHLAAGFVTAWAAICATISGIASRGRRAGRKHSWARDLLANHGLAGRITLSSTAC